MPEEQLNIHDVEVNIYKEGKPKKNTGKQIKKFLALDKKKVSVSKIRDSLGKCLSTFSTVLDHEKINVMGRNYGTNQVDLIIDLQEKEKSSELSFGIEPSFKNPALQLAFKNNNWLGYLYNISVNVNLSKKEQNYYLEFLNPVFAIFNNISILNFTIGFKNLVLNSYLGLKNKITKDLFLSNGVGIDLAKDGVKFIKNHSITFVNMNNGFFPTNKSIYFNTTVSSNNNLYTQAIIWFPIGRRVNIGINSNYQNLSQTNYIRPDLFFICKLTNLFFVEYTTNLVNKAVYSLGMSTPLGVISLPFLTLKDKRKNLILKILA